ncbi:MAG: hypothetical protein AAGL24_22340 [Pseudomonadota bacterium]
MPQRLRHAVGTMILCLALVLLGNPAGAQVMEADVEAIDEGRFGRLVITFKDRTLLPEYATRIASGVLRVDFTEQVNLSVDDVPVALKSYISVALKDPAGFGIRLGLRDRFRINTMEAGEKLFVDILPRDWRGEPPGLPDDVIKELARRAEAALKRVRDLERKRFGRVKKPEVTLRAGRHPTFTRLSFFWNVPFDTNFQREGELVRLVFSRDADLDLYDVLADKPPGLVDFETFHEDNKLKVVLQVDDAVDVRAFREADAYVVDIAPPSNRPQDAANLQVNQALSPEFSPGQTERVIAPGQASNEPAADTRPAAVRTPAQEPEPPVPAASADVDAPTGPQDPEPVADRADEPGDPAEDVEPVVVVDVPAPDADPVPIEPAAAPVPDDTPPAPQGADAADQSASDLPDVAPINTDIAPVDPATDPLAAGTPRRVAIGSDGETIDPQQIPRRIDRTVEGTGEEETLVAANLVEVEASRIGSLTRIVFPFREPTAAAVFKRNDSLWLVFDTSMDLGLDAMRSVLKSVANRIEPGMLDAARTLRIDLKNPALATVGNDGNSWVINIGDLILEPSQPVTFQRHVRADGGMSLAADFSNAGSIRRIRDPRVGDTLFVVTAFGPARGVIKPQRFVEIDALTSAHGVAIVARSDDLSVIKKDDQVVIEQPRGLSLSSKNLAQGVTLLPVKVAVTRPGFLDFNEMHEPHPLRFQRRRAALQRELMRAGEGDKSAQWLALARFYLANRFAQEARGILTLVRQENPTIENDSAFLLMMGMAEILTGHAKASELYIMQTELADSPDADVWKVIHHAQAGEWGAARQSVPRARRAIGSYPPNLQALFNISAAEAAVELNDFGEATAVLAEIDPAIIDPIYAERYDILRARLADVSARPEDAIKLLKRVIEFGKRPTVAEATYRLLRIQHRDNLRPSSEIVDDLRRLAVIWRGDELELKNLRYLAQLLVEQAEYREAFSAARMALFVDSEADTSKLLQDEMNSVFSALFIDGKADDLEPVEALSLFYDFREMTPVGARGDTIVRNLAERLVDVDLLEQAAELLQHQVDNRLKGAARAQIAADLALIYLLDRKPDRALRALRRTRQAKLPETMERQRRLVEARALVEAGRHQTALDLLETLQGGEVERMKADALWAAKKWDDAGNQYERLVGARWSLRAPLSESDRLDVLRSAIGYALGGNQLALDRLRTKFADKMASTEHASAFDAVTRTINVSGAEFSTVATQIAAIDTLEMFLKDYRERYASDKVPSGPEEAVEVAPQPAPETQAEPTAASDAADQQEARATGVRQVT